MALAGESCEMAPGLEILKILPVALYITDAEGTITFFNDAAEKMWGQAPAPGSKWCGALRLYRSDGSPPDARPIFASMLRGAVAPSTDAGAFGPVK